MDSARAAIALDDMRVINHLIMAVAGARLDDSASAHEHLQQARDSWPPELRQAGDRRATAEKGILWFDTADELHYLLGLAENAMQPKAG